MGDFEITFLMVLTSLVSILIFKHYWPKYFEAKATNQATKEDIEEITKIVESVKSDLLTKTDEIKAQLTLKNQHRLNLKIAESEAIYDFNKSCSHWINDISRSNVYGFIQSNIDDIDVELKKLDADKLLYDASEAHILLFVSNKDFIELKKEWFIATLTFEMKLRGRLNQIKLHRNMLLYQESNSEAIDVIKGVKAKIEELGDSWDKEMLKEYSNVISIHSNLQLLLRKILNDIQTMN